MASGAVLRLGGKRSGHRETNWRLASGGGVQHGCKGRVLCQHVLSQEVIGPQEGDRGSPSSSRNGSAGLDFDIAQTSFPHSRSRLQMLALQQKMTLKSVPGCVLGSMLNVPLLCARPAVHTPLPHLLSCVSPAPRHLTPGPCLGPFTAWTDTLP